MKKVLKVLLLAVVIFTLMTSTVAASTYNATNKSKTNTTITPNLVGDCPFYGTHQATSTGMYMQSMLMV